MGKQGYFDYTVVGHLYIERPDRLPAQTIVLAPDKKENARFLRLLFRILNESFHT